MAELKRKRKQTRIEQKDKNKDSRSLNARMLHVLSTFHSGIKSESMRALHMHDILTIIFRNLNGRDLSNAAMVCRTWLEAANREKRLRGPYCIAIRPDEKRSFNCIKQSTIKSSIGFFFITRVRSKKEIVTAQDGICESLPKNCQPIIIFSSVVVSNKEYSYMLDSHPNMCCVLLPQISNVKISIVEISGIHRYNAINIKTCHEYKKYRRMIEETSNRDDETCLMLFSDGNGYEIGKKMYSFAQSRFKKNNKMVSLCNIVSNGILTKNKVHIGNFDPICVAVLITGSIKTWFIVVDKKGETQEQIEKKLKLFKKQVKLQKHSVGFTFSCYKPSICIDVTEIEFFKILFPEIPVIGCIAHDYREYFCGIRERSKLVAGVSIGFMILTYG